MMLFRTLPDAAILTAIGYAAFASAGLVLVGLWTRFASASLALCLMLSQGFANSFGKIDHQNLLFIVPAVMVFSDWGKALSADARRVGTNGQQPPRQWPVRLLAVMIGVEFFTAGYAKFTGGWLDLNTHATQGYVVRRLVVKGHDEMLTPFFASISNGVFWEALDWLTVGLECGIILAAVSWRSYRVILAIATQFHLGILLVLNIAFFGNVLAYGAFVQWSRLLGRAKLDRDWPRIPALIAAAAATLVAITIHGMVPFVVMNRVVVFVGAVIGAAYLVWLALRVLRHRSDDVIGEETAAERQNRTPVGEVE
jgi:uncharacterized membrane protein YphA (DoxX/SURF4 family)